MKQKSLFTWFERGIRRPDVWISLGLYYIVLYFGYLGPHIIFNPLISICSALAVILGVFLDMYTTYLAIKLKPKFDMRGIEFPLVELCPFLPEEPTAIELFGQKQMTITFVECLLGFILPPFGYAQGLGHSLQALRNLRLRDWLKKEYQF